MSLCTNATPPRRPDRRPPGCFDLRALDIAWRKVRANGGGAGGDGQTIRDFEAHRAAMLARLAGALGDGSYRPGPLRRVAIRKRGGGMRELAIPCVVDRVAQTAMLAALTPRVDARMADESFAYRPGRSVAQALARARALIAAGLVWIVDGDIERFFNSIPQHILAQELTIWVDDVALLPLLNLWLSAYAPSGRGVPQGAPLSPLLANLYLHPFDRVHAAAGIAALRYADDFILLCPTRRRAEGALGVAAAALQARGLRLHRLKTRVVHVSDGVDFLGERLITRPGRSTRD